MKRLIVICAVIALLVQGYARADTWTTLIYPGAKETQAMGISGSSIVGYYAGASYQFHGFLYTGTSWTALDYPGAMWTNVYSISGNSIVGTYADSSSQRHGFLYNGTSWTTLNNYPGGTRTEALGISGNSIVGTYTDNSGTVGHSFLYTIPEPATAFMFVMGTVMLKRKFKVQN